MFALLRRHTLLLAAAGVAAWAANVPAGAQPRELRIGVASHVRSLDVNEATGNNEAQFLHNIFDTLIERDNYASPLKFVPGLATSWKMVAPTTMELKLRDGVVRDPERRIYRDAWLPLEPDNPYGWGRELRALVAHLFNDEGRAQHTYGSLRIDGDSGEPVIRFHDVEGRVRSGAQLVLVPRTR